MTQRNNQSQILQAAPTGVPAALRFALGVSIATALVLIGLVLITVQPGAGYGFV